jgi:hypothetical protein
MGNSWKTVQNSEILIHAFGSAIGCKSLQLEFFYKVFMSLMSFLMGLATSLGSLLQT